MTEDSLSLRDKLRAIYEVVKFRPVFTLSIVALSVVVAGLEGVGMGFILPIIEIAQNGPEQASGFSLYFLRVFRFLGVPFDIGYVIFAVGIVIGIRFSLSILVMWAGGVLRFEYVRDLRDRAFTNALYARTAYFDQEGSDEILNAIITQTQYAGESIFRLTRVLELSLISLAYLALALVLSPILTVITAVVVGGVMFGVRHVLESGYDLGERVADANERVQVAVQSGMQGIRDVKVFNLQSEILDTFRRSLEEFTTASIEQERNRVTILNANQFLTAASVFALVYVGLEIVNLSLGTLGVFLFVMFRLGPKISNLNNEVYNLENQLPHLVRTQGFIKKLQTNREPFEGESIDGQVNQIKFDNVTFGYGEGGVLHDLSFEAERGEFIAFVGPSGAGKSTIVSLLARMYEPDSGRILADGVSIDEINISTWRERVAVVRQNPFIFNDTLRNNLTLGCRDASGEEFDEVCSIAQINEFLDRLPEGYDTVLGDQGVRLSGGQKQRVAIARGLLKDADLLILDEATSDLDSHLEKRVHQGIEELDEEHITIAIAHRLSTVTAADRIYTMEEGMITENGTHEELLEVGGRYAELYKLQTGTS